MSSSAFFPFISTDNGAPPAYDMIHANPLVKRETINGKEK